MTGSPGSLGAAPLYRTLDLKGRGPGQMAVLDFGPPDRPVDIIFLHANGFNALTYRAILAPLGADLRILALDQRGHGGSTLEADERGRFDWLDLRDDLIAAMACLDLSGLVLAGHSMGATVSLLAAGISPGLARHLVLFEPVIADRDTLADHKARAMADSAARRRAAFPGRAEALAAYQGRGAFRTWPDEMFEDYISAGFRPLAEGGVRLACTPAWEASNYAAQAHLPSPLLEAPPCEIDIYRGDVGSTFILPDSAVALNTGKVRLHTVPGTTHFLPMERPDLARAALRDAASSFRR